jgi:hypothetical protein
VVWRSSCRRVMLKQEELAFIKALSTFQVPPAVLTELTMALSRKKKRLAVPAGRRSTAPRSWAGAHQRPSGQLAGKRKANELASSGDSFAPANRRPEPSEGSAPMPASAPAVTGEQAASCSRQLGPPEGGVTYAAVLAGTVAPFQTSGLLKPTAMDSEPSESAVSPETVKRRMSNDMSGPLSDMPNGSTNRAQVPTSAYQQESVLIRRPFVFQVSVTPVHSWPGCGRPAPAV